jgi:CelD/BcsL family acetyltransferase involved in cellulose biosynthesis
MSLATPQIESASAPGNAVVCRVVEDIADLQSHQSAWLDLLERSSANEPMLSPCWLLPWWRVYGQASGRRLKVGLFFDGDRLIGMAPLQLRRYRYRFGLPFQRLEFLGADVDENDGVCSEYLNLIAEQGREEEIARRFAAALMGGAFGDWHELVLATLDGNGVMPGLARNALDQAGLWTQQQETTAASYIPLPKSWDDYLQALGKHRRYVNKTLRDFEQWAAGKAEYHRAGTATEMEQGRRILHELHGQRWQSAGQEGVFQSPRFAGFHDEVMRSFFDQGLLDLHWLTVGGEALAAVYNFRRNNKVYFYQSGRKLDVPNHIRTGIVLHAHCIRQAIDNGCREYDFLGGFAQYKQQLALASRPVLQVRAIRPGLRERLRRGIEAGVGYARRVRNAVRSFLARFKEKPVS